MTGKAALDTCLGNLEPDTGLLRNYGIITLYRDCIRVG